MIPGAGAINPTQPVGVTTPTSPVIQPVTKKGGSTLA